MKEYSNMKLTLKELLCNRIAVLCIINLLIAYWLVWYESQIIIEPALPEDIAAGRYIPPIIMETYNTIIVSIIVNIVVLIRDITKSRNIILSRRNLIIRLLYVVIVAVCMCWGYNYISSRMDSDVIVEYNPLFRFPIMLCGKESVTSVVTAINLYVSLCTILVGNCIIVIHQSLRQRRR